MRWLFLFFIVVPLVELYLLLWLGSIIGFWPTVGITIVTGVLGGSLAKREGIRVWRQWRTALAEMRPPETGVVDGVLVLIGGALLITPGVLTDLTGLFLLLPPTRKLVAAAIRRRIDAKIASGSLQVMDASSFSMGFEPEPMRWSEPAPRASGSDVVDTTGESVDLDAPVLPPRGG
ncbi:MAG: FxsA family protein [Myxococcales bacterium]|nr:FxsA family protein [Myxococcales bacterium]MCB9580652.1 FxsA family protein [Polyangiaceae bacterium]